MALLVGGAICWLIGGVFTALPEPGVYTTRGGIQSLVGLTGLLGGGVLFIIAGFMGGVQP